MKVIFTDQDAVLFNGPLFPAPKAAARGSRAPQFRLGGAGVPDAAPTAPAQFATNQWSVSTGLEANQVVLDISELPDTGGSPITALQYNTGGGWVDLDGTGTGPRTLDMASAGTSYTFAVRAVNAVDPGGASGTKSATSGAAAVTPPPPSAQRVIVLTDYAGDCDDAAATAIIARAVENGDINLLGVVATSTVATSAPGVYGQLNAYGLGSTPIYAYQGTAETYNDRFSIQVRDAHGVPGQTRSAYQGDVTGLRTMLAAAPNASVRLIDIGAPVSTARLMDSPADAISPMTGMELIAAKVIDLYAMAGNFPTGVSEYNMNRNIAASQRVYSDFPRPIIAHGGEVGATVFTGPAPNTAVGSDPVRTAFDAFSRIYSGTLQNGQRQSWDPATAYHAIYGDGALFSLSAPGTISVAGDGVSTWTASAGGTRRYVSKVASDTAIASALQAVINEQAIVTPATNRWFDLNEGTGSPTARSGSPAMARASGATWRTAPVGIAHSGTTSYMTLPATAEMNSADMIIGAVVRLGRITGTQAIATLRVGDFNQYQFRANGSTLEYVGFSNGNTATIITSASLLTVGSWALVVTQVTDTAAAVRLNGAQVASNSFASRNKADPSTTTITVGGRYTGSTYSDMLQGDLAAFGYTTGADATGVAACETELRSIATSKGITLP